MAEKNDTPVTATPGAVVNAEPQDPAAAARDAVKIEPAPKPAPPTMVQVADLDAESIYWGLKDKMFKEIAAGDVVFGAEAIAPEDRIEGAVYLEGGCDLPGGVQRWMPGGRRFEPIRGPAKTSPTAPSMERAFYALAVVLRASGAPLPPTTEEWVAWYAGTFDGPGKN